MTTKLQLFTYLLISSFGLSHAFAKEETTVTPVKKISAQQAKEIADSGVRVLMHIAEARGNIREKKYTQANDNLNQAQTLINIIRAEEPTFRVKNRIWVAQKHLEYEDVNQVTPDLVPIYADMDFLAEYVPTKEARAHLDKAKESLKRGDKKTAQNEFKLADAALVYQEVDLPVSKTNNLINSAKVALSQKKYDQADRDLKMAEQSVQVTENIVTSQSPKASGSSTSSVDSNASQSNKSNASPDSSSKPADTNSKQ